MYCDGVSTPGSALNDRILAMHCAATTAWVQMLSRHTGAANVTWRSVATVLSTHTRQRHTHSHALSELSSLLLANEDLEKKLARIRETSAQQERSRRGEEEEKELEKQQLLVQFKAEEDKRLQEAAQRKEEQEKCIRQLEHKAARKRSASEEEARRRKAEEEKLELKKQKLEETIVVPLSVLNLGASNGSAFTTPRSTPPKHPDRRNN